MNKKIKVLIVPSDTQGVGHFRSIWPAQSMERDFSDEIEVEINHQPNFNNVGYFQGFDIVHFHRHIGPYENSAELFPKIQASGTILVMDIDDFWEPPSTHPLYEIVKKDKLSEKIVNNLKLSDYVTTTTEVFADYIKKYNPNVGVIPNALNMEHQMWSSDVVENKTDKCRISWIGGSSHYHDLELMRHGFNLLWSNQQLKDKFQIIMCGFDTRGTITQVNHKGERTTRNIQPHETIWCKFEEIFTSNYKDSEGDPEYYKWLKKIQKPRPEDYKDEQYNKNYVRRWTLPLTQYGKHYDYCDVCLAPLVDTYDENIIHTKKDGGQAVQLVKRKHIFNEVKSELKIIEAGMKKKVLIAQDFGIYSKLIEDGKTGLLVKNDQKDWYKHMKRVIEDPAYRQELANNLHEFVKDKYEITNVTANRIKLYKQIIQEHNEKVAAGKKIAEELSSNK
ncbi:MAG: glycosyltransferase [Nanoarchaeota archaeon]|mgnify:CR=1 FL=1